MFIINLFFCVAAVYFMAEIEDNPLLFWLNALSFTVNYAAFMMAMLS